MLLLLRFGFANPRFSGMLVCAGVLIWVFHFWISIRREEQEREENNQPHTFKDSAYLLLSGIFIAVAGLYIGFNHQKIFKNAAVFAVLMLAIAFGLTRLFNRARS